VVTISSDARPRVHESPFWQGYARSRYAILFFALLLMLVVMPIAETIGMPGALIKILLGATLLAAVMPNATRRTRILFCAMVFLLTLARFASERGDLPVAPGLILAIVGLTGLLAAAGALRFAVQAEAVNTETIYAALSTYLLAGLFFGQLYWSIEQVTPGSLTGPEPLTAESSVYYSFVTLASLGYGDILPRSDMARGIAVFEVVGGQLYLAVLVARLIGLFTTDKTGR
jgi:hypothetical protein